MYNVVSVLVRNNREWYELDYTDLLLSDLVSVNHTVHVTVHDGEQSENTFNLRSALQELRVRTDNKTLDEWVATLELLPWKSLVNQQPLDNVRKMHVTDIYHWDVKYEIGNYEYGRGQSVPLGSSTDLMIYNKGDVDVISWMQRHCLFSINGFVHRSEVVGDALVVRHALAYLRASGTQAAIIRVIDLSELGEWSWHVMDSAELKVLEPTDNDRNRNETRVTYEHAGLSGKSIAGVLDAHPHLFDGVFTMHDADHVMITLNRKAMVQHESKNPVPSHADGLVDGVLSLSNFDAVQYLNHGVSGIIIFENPDVNVKRTLMGRTDIPGLYTSHRTHSGIMVDSKGWVVDYTLEGLSTDMMVYSTTAGYRRAYLSDMYGQRSYLSHGEYAVSAIADDVYAIDLYATMD